MDIHTHDSIEKSVIEAKSDLNFEEVCLLEIKLRGGDRMLFGSFYRSPSPTDISEENNNNLNKLLMNLSNKYYRHKCFVGDFNFKDINWETWTTFHNEESKETKFIEVVFCFSTISRIHVNEATMHHPLLTLFLKDEDMQVSEVERQSPLGKSDHDVIIFKLLCYLDYTKSKGRYAYEKGDYEATRKEVAQTGRKNLSHQQMTTTSKDSGGL